ncbi:tetratricopeptide repeat protein [Methanolacinia paynteri]|uniref:hypothetical protein n=1 Tax=Methanolacinia paynteri TaxID=230356 RepID=UPI00064F699E|nr:hypothetical protein [Methanolacinia paynteri]
MGEEEDLSNTFIGELEELDDRLAGVKRSYNSGEAEKAGSEYEFAIGNYYESLEHLEPAIKEIFELSNDNRPHIEKYLDTVEYYYESFFSWKDTFEHDFSGEEAEVAAILGLARGRLLAMSGEYSSALDKLAGGFNSSPEEYQAAFCEEIGNVLYELEEYHAALESYEEAIAREWDRPGAWQGKMLTLMDLERPGEALNAAHMVMELCDDESPENYVAKTSTVICNFDLGKYREVVDNTPVGLPESEETDDLNALLWYYRYIALKKTGAPEHECNGAYEEAVRYNPDIESSDEARQLHGD